MSAIDWTTLPAPQDDGAAAHLTGASLPDLSLPSTKGGQVQLVSLKGTSVLYIYPLTATADGATPNGWDAIPGARGCTPQSCAFRDNFADLQALGVSPVFGVSVQDTAYQREAAERLHLPFPLLSDAAFSLQKALCLPAFDDAGTPLLKRMAWVVEDATIVKLFYPVFPPDRNAQDVLDWLAAR